MIDNVADPNSLPLAQEVPTITKRLVAGDRVIVRTTVEQHEELVREELAEENVDVTRVPVNKVVEHAPVTRTQGDVTIVPVFEERLAIVKQLVLVEEVHIRRRRSIEQVELPVTLRREVATVERHEVESIDKEAGRPL